MTVTKRRPRGRSAALVLVNYQVDYLTSLRAVKGAKKVVATTNSIRNAFNWDTVVRLEVSHGPRQLSFLSTHIMNGTNAAMGDVQSLPDGSSYKLKADHCVRGTDGANCVADLEVDPSDHVVLAGTDASVPGYSAFRDLQPDVKGVTMTNLNKHLRSNDITDVYVLGLGFEEMVSRTALDAKTLGFNTNVITDMSLGWSPSAALAATSRNLEGAGVVLLDSKTMLNLNTDHRRAQAATYLEDNGITFIMEKLTAALVYQQPADPRAFMVAELQKIAAQRNAGSRLSLITAEELQVIFRMMDPLNKGQLSGRQIRQGLQGTVVRPKQTIDPDAIYDVAGFQDLVLREAVVEQVVAAKKVQSKRAENMLRSVFLALDRDMNDSLTKAELWAAMKGSPLEVMLANMLEDLLDVDAVIPFATFMGWFAPIPDDQVEIIRSRWLVNYFKKQHSAKVIDLLSRLFKKWDADSSGSLMISEVAESIRKTTVFGSSEDPAVNAEIQEKNIARIMRADTNGDDLISMQEFIAFMDDGIPDEYVPKLVEAFGLEGVEPFNWEESLQEEVKADVKVDMAAEEATTPYDEYTEHLVSVFKALELDSVSRKVLGDKLAADEQVAKLAEAAGGGVHQQLELSSAEDGAVITLEEFRDALKAGAPPPPEQNEAEKAGAEKPDAEKAEPAEAEKTEAKES